MTARESPASYVHGAEDAEQERLERQHRLLGGAGFLPPLKAGIKVLEIGSGTGAIARDVARLVAPGSVVGIDGEEKQVEKARRLARDQGVANVEFRVGRAQALEFPDETFDAVYCRFLLEHVPDPVSVVREMARVAKPGGTLIACECQVGCCSTTRPPLTAAAKALAALYRLQAVKGGDPRIADKLGKVFADAGLADVQADTLTHEFNAPDEVRAYASGGAQMLKASERDLLSRGLLSRTDLARAYQDWEKLPRATGAAAWFKLRRVQGRKPSR